ncbi:MAG: helix-turn-helix domain-containing protein [Sphaerochaetaceae bacterium]
MGIKDIGDNIRRNMKIRGLTIPQLSAQMGIGTATLSNILNGKAEPKSSTLIKLAESLKVPFDELLADAPILNSLRFRTSKTLSGREKAERDQLRHDTSIWLSDYQYLEDVLKEKEGFLLKDIREKNPEKAANEVRKSLKLKPEEPICDICDLMERAGIKLHIRPFGFKKTFGLSVGEEDGGPAIVVNSESGITIERQIFTIAHELGHIVLHKNSYDASLELENPIEENEANIFAGAFLVPSKGFEKDWNEAKGLHWVNRVLRVKKIYKVSYLTILVRLVQLNPELQDRLIIAEFCSAYRQLYQHDLKDHYEPDAIQDPVASFDPQGLDVSDLVEDRFSRLVRKAYDGQIISLSRAGEMMNRSIEDMRDLIRAWQVH